MLIKQRVLVDLSKGKSVSPYSDRTQKVNLSRSKILKIPFIRAGKIVVWAVVFSYLVFGSVLAPIDHGQWSFAAQNEEERQQLEKQLADLEAQMNQYQGTIDKYRSEGKNLEGEIARLNAQIGKINLQIKAVQLTLKKLNGEIVFNLEKISDTETEIGKNKIVLKRYLQNINANDDLTVVEILLKKPHLSDFFAEVNNLVALQDGMREALAQTLQLKDTLLTQRQSLALKKNDAEQLKVFQDAQRKSIEQTKSAKANILSVTKGNEAKYKTLLKETQKTAAQIRSRIFELLGGGELSFEDAYKFAKFAEQATGVRAALILAVLDRESALGQNVGRCSYQKAMHPTRDIPVFLDLLKELNINPDTVTVSCPNRDGLYGGAMGPAQFIPSTWKLYQTSISNFTGSNPPSPWKNSDAFMATALYLKDSGAANASLSQERIAAARYYAGGRWRTYLWTYGDRVVTQAERFQKDIDILNS